MASRVFEFDDGMFDQLERELRSHVEAGDSASEWLASIVNEVRTEKPSQELSQMILAHEWIVVDQGPIPEVENGEVEMRLQFIKHEKEADHE